MQEDNKEHRVRKSSTSQLEQV